MTVTTQNKANNACGIGLGMTTGFVGTDAYAYVLMRNSNNSTNGTYVNGSGSVSAGAAQRPVHQRHPAAAVVQPHAAAT